MGTWFEATVIVGWKIVSFANVGDRNRAEDALDALHAAGEFVGLDITRGYSEVSDDHGATFEHWEFFLTIDHMDMNKNIDPEIVIERRSRSSQLQELAETLAKKLDLKIEPLSVAATLV